MADMFDPSQQPNMSPNDPAMYGNPGDSYQYPGNAMYQQQQSMLNQTYYSDPSIQITRPGMGQTMSMASNQLAGQMGNVMQGTMQASGDLMRGMSNFSNSANRFVKGPRYNDQYFGPNNFALETSMRREVGSAMGFDHSTAMGRFVLGGHRPDFMTETDFSRQMEAAKAQRFTSGNMMDFASSAGWGVGAMFAPMSLGMSLIAPAAIKLTTHAIRSFDHGMREEEAIAASWAKRANMRIGYGAEGFLDQSTDAALSSKIEAHDLGRHAGTSAFLGKSMSRKFGLRPEIQHEEVREQMEQLGMFSQRTTGKFDDKKISDAIKGIADEMKQLAGIARVLKEQIPAAAAELQKAGGFGYEQTNKYMGLTRNIASLAATTGLDFNRLTGATSEMMQTARAMGFAAEGTGQKLTEGIGQISALKSAGLIGAGINEIEFAQKLQMGAMHNARTNPFAMMAAGQTTGEFRNEMTNNPGAFFNRQNQTMTGTGIGNQLQTMDSFLSAIKQHGSAEKISQYGERNLLMTFAREQLLPNGTFEEQKALVDMHYIGQKQMDRIARDEAIIAQSKNGTLVEKIMRNTNKSRAEAEKEKDRVLEIARGGKDGMKLLIGGGLDKLDERALKQNEYENSFFARFGGEEAFKNKAVTKTDHWGIARRGSTGFFSVINEKDQADYIREELKQNPKLSIAEARWGYVEKQAMSKEEFENLLRSKEGTKKSFGKNAATAEKVAAYIQKALVEDIDPISMIGEAQDLAGKAGVKNTADFVNEVIAAKNMTEGVLGHVKNFSASSPSEKSARQVERLTGLTGGVSRVAREIGTLSRYHENSGNTIGFALDVAANQSGVSYRQEDIQKMSFADKVTAAKKLEDELGRQRTDGGVILSDVERAAFSKERFGIYSDIEKAKQEHIVKFGSDDDKMRANFGKLAGDPNDKTSYYVKGTSYSKWAEKQLTGHEGMVDRYLNKQGIPTGLSAKFKQLMTENKDAKGIDGKTNNSFGAAQAQMEEWIGASFNNYAATDEEKKFGQLLVGENGAAARKALLIQAAEKVKTIPLDGSRSQNDDTQKIVANTYRKLISSGLTDETIRKDIKAINNSGYAKYFGGESLATETFEGNDANKQRKTKANNMAKFILGNETLVKSLENMKEGGVKVEELKAGLRSNEVNVDLLGQVTDMIGKSGGLQAGTMDEKTLDLFDKNTSASAINKLSEILNKIYANMTGTEYVPEKNPDNPKESGPREHTGSSPQPVSGAKDQAPVTKTFGGNAIAEQIQKEAHRMGK